MNKLDMLIQRFVNLFPTIKKRTTGMSTDVEKHLGIKMPEEFDTISHYYNGNNGFMIDGLFAYEKTITPDNIIDRTITYREIDICVWPKQFLALGELSESMIILHSLENLNKESPIYWISLSDVCNLCESKALEDSPIIFPTFADFFEYLLVEEEKARGIIPS